jgi:ribosomal protein S18 acetylase RimI-like enzyme
MATIVIRAAEAADVPVLFEMLRASIALSFFNYSTWTSRHGLYLEDLYVAPAFRRLGVARALMQRLEAMAVERGCERLQWLVLRENLGAIRFYESQSARALPDWLVMLKRLSSSP